MVLLVKGVFILNDLAIRGVLTLKLEMLHEKGLLLKCDVILRDVLKCEFIERCVESCL